MRVVQTATTRILRRRFPGTCETVGQVFKFFWRLRWKINVVCMSLSPFVCFQSLFVTYLLTYPRSMSTDMYHIQRMNTLSRDVNMAHPMKRRVVSPGFCETLATSTKCVHLSLRQLTNAHTLKTEVKLEQITMAAEWYFVAQKAQL